MVPLEDLADIIAFVSALLLLQLHVQEMLQQALQLHAEREEDLDVIVYVRECEENVQNMNLVAAVTLHCFRNLNLQFLFADDFGFWVKPRSTTWFSRFVIDQFDDDRWVQHFRMIEATVFRLADMLSPHIRKQNTRYRLSIPVIVRVACTLFKLAQDATFIICSEFFAVGVSTVSGMLYDTVRAINIVFCQEISWPSGQRLVETQAAFKALCSLPAVVGAIDGTHIHIAKPA
jgi:hypothetical protein